MIRNSLAFLISFSLVFTPPLWAAQPGPLPKSELDQQIVELENLLAMARELRSHIDRTTFDLDALIDALDYDAQLILEFVKEEISFEQYPGALRGALGTLMSRAGNSLDQSILLAKLLRDAGYDARIVRGRLNDAQVATLLGELKRPRSAPAAIGDPRAFAATLDKYSSSTASKAGSEALTAFLEGQAPAQQSPWYDSVTGAAAGLRARLTQAGISLGADNTTEAILQEAKEYFWVQLRETASDPWQDQHPAFSEVSAIDVAAEEFFADAIPARYQHRLRFQVVNEVRRGAGLQASPIMEPWERPTANLNGVPMTFGNVPDTMMGGLRTVDLDQALETAGYLVPVFNGAAAAGARFFDLQGNAIDPMVAGNQAAGVVKNINRAFTAATGGLGGEAILPTLTAQWLEFTLIEPDGTETVFRRTTFDRIGPAARAEGRAPEGLKPTMATDARTLMQRHTFMISQGATPRGMVLDHSLERMLKTYPALLAMLKKLGANEEPTAQELQQLAGVPTDWPGHLALFSLFDGADQLSRDHRSYRSAPALVVHRQGLAEEQGSTLSGIDVVANPRRSFSLAEDRIRLDPYATLTGGVWETDLEGVLLEPGGTRVDTGSVFAAAEAAAVPIEVLASGRPMPDLKLPADALHHIESDLGRDYAVIVPRRAADDEWTGWWRVNLQTGETVGQLGDGRGAELSEYLGVMNFGISISLLVAGWANCVSQWRADGDTSAANCCVIANFALFGIGAVGGMYYSAAAMSVRTGNISWEATRAIALGSAAYDVIGYFVPVCDELGY